MSTINIEIVDVTVEEVARPSGKGSYEKATVAFKNSEGKLEAKTLMDWASKEIWPSIVAAKKGDTFSIERTKNDKGYWDWVGIARQEMPVAPSNPTKAPAKPTYETPEERAHRQVLIVRQSSVSNAVALLGPKAKVEEVLKVADTFYNYVMQIGVEHLENDPV